MNYAGIFWLAVVIVMGLIYWLLVGGFRIHPIVALFVTPLAVFVLLVAAAAIGLSFDSLNGRNPFE